MSDSLGNRWAALAASRRPALIPYVTAGFPSRAATLDTLRMLEDEGADIIEVGIPFSDPLADGPVIQQSSDVALRNGMSVAGALELTLEAGVSTPVVAFSYLNPLLAYGLDRFLQDAASAGVSGLLVTDLTTGADPALERALSDGPLAHIRLVALTTRPARLDEVLRDARGFVYLISRLGVTGGSAEIGTAIEAMVADVRARTRLPIAVGFGIDSAEKARRVATFADGVVIGSALVARLADGLAPARALVRDVREALDAVPVG